MNPVDVYARVSRLRDRNQTSTPAQVASCRAVLEERGLPVGEIHVDDGRSAWNPKVRRAGWEVLMARLESGEAGGVIVFDLERFARQLDDGQRLVRAAERGLVVLDSEGEYDLRRPGDKKNFLNAIVAAQYYSDLLQVKVRRGKKAKARDGRVDMRRSFGFEPDGVTVREDEAAIIRDHAARLLAGETQDALIRELNETGVPSVRGARWGYTTYRQIMTRPRNAGYIVHNGQIVDGVRLPGEPILDQLTHDRIVALYAARRAGGQPSGKYLLTGFAICGQSDCGAALSGRPVSGTPRRQYWCKQCRKTFVDARRLDDWAGGWTVRTLSDPQHADALAAAARELSAARARLTAEAADIEATLTEIGARLGRREISLQRHDAICGPLEARQAEISRELAHLAAEEADRAPLPPGTRTLSARDARHVEWLAEWTEGTDAERRAMVRRALGGQRIVVGPGEPAHFTPERVAVRAA